VAEFQLSYKSNVKSDRPKMRWQILKDNWDESKIELVEQFKLMLTNRAHKVLGILEVSTGGVSGTLANPKVTFAARA
jgi:DNA repair protein RadC